MRKGKSYTCRNLVDFVASYLSKILPFAVLL